ncbi:MAG: hypothetical protein M3010_05300 [Candidatus Dormibacteraeota bacterium]|nr:hypothetical protein [Candidatus Dormibacteraeota bacterium]
MDAQRGQVAIMFALVLALVLTGIVALVGDVILLYDAAGRYDNGALVGAQAGASQVDRALLRQGVVALDPARAGTVCAEAATITSGLPGAEVRCTVSVDKRSVTSHVSHRVPLVFAVYGPGLTITRDHTGTIAVGESQGTSP